MFFHSSVNSSGIRYFLLLIHWLVQCARPFIYHFCFHVYNCYWSEVFWFCALSHFISVLRSVYKHIGNVFSFVFCNAPEGLYIKNTLFVFRKLKKTKKQNWAINCLDLKLHLGGNSLTTFLKFLFCLLIYPIFYFLNIFIYVFEIFTFVSPTFP